MNDAELQAFERQLRSYKPAPPDPGLRQRLDAARPLCRPVSRSREEHSAPSFPVLTWLRWLIPASAVAVLVALALWNAEWGRQPGLDRGTSTVVASARPIPVEKLQIDRRLVQDYDIVARLPNGEPMRFRYSEYMDTVLLRDAETGAEVQRRIPGVEIVPVGFETY